MTKQRHTVKLLSETTGRCCPEALWTIDWGDVIHTSSVISIESYKLWFDCAIFQ